MRKIFLQCFPFLIALTPSLGNAQANSEICHSKFLNWIQANGGADPFQAVQKTTPWPFLRSVLFQIKSDDIHIPDGDLGGFHFQNETEKEEMKKAFLSTLKNSEPPNSRDLAIRQNLTEFVRSHLDLKQSLSISYVGLYHGIDLFLSSPELKPTYINKPFALDTLTEPDEMRQLQDYLKIPTPPRTVGDDQLSYFSLPYLYTKQALSSLNLSGIPARTFQAQETSTHLLVMTELHGMVSTNWISTFPNASCLKAMGLKVIYVAMEGYTKGHKFGPQDLIRRRTFIEQFSYRARKLGMTLNELAAKFPESIGSKLLAGKIVDNPAPLLFAEKLLTYQKEGLEIHMEGLESPTYDELEGD